MIASNDFRLDDTSGSNRSGLTLPLGIILYIIFYIFHNQSTNHAKNLSNLVW